jgi:hypothetical protein
MLVTATCNTRVFAVVACTQTPTGLQTNTDWLAVSEVCVEIREVFETFAGRATDAAAV